MFKKIGLQFLLRWTQLSQHSSYITLYMLVTLDGEASGQMVMQSFSQSIHSVSACLSFLSQPEERDMGKGKCQEGVKKEVIQLASTSGTLVQLINFVSTQLRPAVHFKRSLLGELHEQLGEILTSERRRKLFLRILELFSTRLGFLASNSLHVSNFFESLFIEINSKSQLDFSIFCYIDFVTYVGVNQVGKRRERGGDENTKVRSIRSENSQAKSAILLIGS